MSVLFIVVPAALFVVVMAILAYLWAARRGQFDDLTTPAMRILHDDERLPGTRTAPPGASETTKPAAPPDATR